MNNIDFTGTALLKLIGIAVATVLGASQLSFNTGSWKSNIETRLIVVEKKIDALDSKVDKNFLALNSKIDKNFHKIIDLLKK